MRIQLRRLAWPFLGMLFHSTFMLCCFVCDKYIIDQISFQIESHFPLFPNLVVNNKNWETIMGMKFNPGLGEIKLTLK